MATKISENITIESTFELEYLQRIINRDKSNNNLFMDGQDECAKHAMTLIGELIGKLSAK